MSERVMRFPVPDMIVDRFDSVRPDDIPADIKALGLDVDGVLTFFHDGWLNGTIETALQRNAEVRDLFLITNSYGKRADELQEIFKRVPLTEIVTPQTISELGENPKRHRKPHPDMLLHAIGRLGIAPSEFMMFDDQLSAGGEAAARAGARMALVPRLGRLDHLGVRVFRRGPEALARAAMGIPFRGADFPGQLTSVEKWRTLSREERVALAA